MWTLSKFGLHETPLFLDIFSYTDEKTEEEKGKLDQEDIEAARLLQRMISDSYEDREVFERRIAGLFYNLVKDGAYEGISYENNKPDEKSPSRYSIACYHMISNIDMIYTYSESPIEKLFLCSLLAVNLRRNPFFLTITPPLVGDVFPDIFHSCHQRLLDVKKFHRDTPVTLQHVVEAWDFFSELYNLSYKLIPKHLDAIGKENLEYLTYGIGMSYHITLQPTFQEIQVEGKSIRPDMLFWIPMCPDFKLIVECDGYDYHSNKETFARDRIRDRTLQQQGYQVFRFSGREIVQHSIQKTDEFMDYLFELSSEFGLEIEEAQMSVKANPSQDVEQQKYNSSKHSNQKKTGKLSSQHRRRLRHAQRKKR